MVSVTVNGKTRQLDVAPDTAMAGHICRCGTYQRIRAAIHRAATLKRGGA
jgi:isoquinoline 1-oxidoreductase alpha subunit